MDKHILTTLLTQSKGQFFSVLFKKLDGTYRKLNGRLGVYKHLKDPFLMGKVTQQDIETGRITVYDVKHKGYRSFYLDRVAELRIRKFCLVNYGDIK